MKLDPLLIQKNLFTLFTAPVAQGKTRSIIELYRENPCKMIFISPLRALATEVYQKLKESEGKNVFFTGEKSQDSLSRQDQYLNFIARNKAILITTVELLENEFLDLIETEENPILFVFDEFHLFYTWGECFRPILHDTFLGVLNTEHPVIALSATMNEKVIENLKSDLKFYTDRWVYLNVGNQELFRKPQKINHFKGHSKKILERAFIREVKIKKSNEVFLFFCSYRQEVDEKLDWARRHGLRAIGCVGGEVDKFQDELRQRWDCLDCIFSTVALSHGVNLPEIKKVFINYEVGDFDFWLQMVGRGGREGSPYEVYTFDSFEQGEVKKNKWKNYWGVILSDWVGVEV